MTSNSARMCSTRGRNMGMSLKPVICISISINHIYIYTCHIDIYIIIYTVIYRSSKHSTTYQIVLEYVKISCTLGGWTSIHPNCFRAPGWTYVFPDMTNGLQPPDAARKSNLRHTHPWSHLGFNILSKSGWWLGHPSEKYESQLGRLFPIYGKIKNVPNHQPEIVVSRFHVWKFLEGRWGYPIWGLTRICGSCCSRWQRVLKHHQQWILLV